MRGGGVVRVLFGLLFFGVSAAVEGVDTIFQEGPLRINPSSVVVRYGDRVTVNCTVSGPHEGIGWEASEGSVPMVQNVQFVTWRLDNITDWKIHPICFGNFHNGSHHIQDQKRLRITLYKTPDSVVLSAVNQTGPMPEGQEYLLMCVVKSIAPVQKLSVRWYKGKRELVKQTFHDDLIKTPVDVSSSHRIRPTIADDGEQYSCVAELDLGPDGPQPPPLIKSEPFTLAVHGKPRITDCIDLVELREGESLNTLVSCRVEGNPNPEVTWYKDQSQFSSSTPLTMRDAGQYAITARNAVGSENVSFTLGYAPVFNCSAKYTVSVNEHFSITCKPEGFPLPKIILFKEDDYEEVELSAQITDAGEYTIIAWNDFGTANHSLDVEVLYPPSEIVELESEEVDFGAAVVLKCSSQGNPRPWYNWTYHRVPNVQELSFDGISLLKISGASKENDGLYICHAVNQIGQTSKTATLTVRGKKKLLWTASSECPIKLEPSTVVVRYGDPVSVNCSVPEEDHSGIGWEASEGSVNSVTGVKFVTWRRSTLTDWNIGPRCFGNFPTETGRPLQCDEKLNITVYKPPDSVLISAGDHKGPMLEGTEYLLQCDVQNIAPVQRLTVRWYKGERELENRTLFSDDSKTPVNVSSTLLITPTSADDGEQYRFVAELDLGSEGPQPPPSITSEPLNITVHYPPFFYSPRPESLKELEGEGVTLNCSAQGNPPPAYSWSSPVSNEKNASQMPILSISLPTGTHEFTCEAFNYLGRKSKDFTVEIEAIADYLPLIAWIVALSVLFILIAFLFIYCIYYKNTKMGQYNLKGGKSPSQSAHVAQNGKDSSLPMKKLTQPV